MAMGAKPSPEVLQTIVEILVEEALTRSGLRAVVVARVHIDNVRFTSTRHCDVAKIGDIFRKVCEEANVTLNAESVNEPHQQGVFLGMLFDYRTSVVSVGPKAMTKLARRATAIDNAKATWADIICLYNSCVFASRVQRVCMARFWPIIKYMRRRARAFAEGSLALDDPAELWPSVRPHWHELIEVLSTNTPTAHGSSKPSGIDTVLFTDASTTGWGAVLVQGGIIKAYGGRWKSTTLTSADINDLEMSAVSLGTKHFSEDLRGKSFIVVVDNTSTYHVLRKGSAREMDLNAAAALALESLSGRGDVFVMWLSTLLNPADGWSRLAQDGNPSPSATSLAVSAALGALAGGAPCVRACVRRPFTGVC
jgi:hypothetical protein